jgi:hypothetical protein
MDKTVLISALRTGFSQEDARSGLTPLDRLIESVLHQTGFREAITELLPEVVNELESRADWHALEVLIAGAGLQSAVVGELIEGRVATLGADDAGARIWAARCAIDLNATLSSTSFNAINEKSSRESNPGEWLSIVMESCERSIASRIFEDTPKHLTITEKTAVDLIRVFKRSSTRSNLDWNFSVSAFFDNLQPQLAVAVAEKVQALVGHTFVLRARERVRTDAPAHVNMNFEHLFVGINIVKNNTMWSRRQATQGTRVSAHA